jgi:hypothetical protein
VVGGVAVGGEGISSPPKKKCPFHPRKVRFPCGVDGSVGRLGEKGIWVRSCFVCAIFSPVCLWGRDFLREAGSFPYLLFLRGRFPARYLFPPANWNPQQEETQKVSIR